MPEEEGMSASPAFVSNVRLSSTEGALVSVSIRVEPRDLEDLLEALARVEFPVNPQIYHEAEIVWLDSQGFEHRDLTTLVEFPAYLGRLEEVYAALESEGFSRDSVLVTSMLDELRSPTLAESAVARSGWFVRSRRKSSESVPVLPTAD
jgi:hypothetical protein